MLIRNDDKSKPYSTSLWEPVSPPSRKQTSVAVGLINQRPCRMAAVILAERASITNYTPCPTNQKGPRPSSNTEFLDKGADDVSTGLGMTSAQDGVNEAAQPASSFHAYGEVSARLIPVSLKDTRRMGGGECSFISAAERAEMQVQRRL